MMNQNIIPAEKRNNKELCACPQHEEFANADFNVSSPSVDDNAFLSSNTTILSEANNLTKNEGTSKNENDVTNTDECGNETWDKQLITGIINLKLQCQKLQQQHIEFEKR